MAEQPTSYDLYWVRSFFRSEPHNLECFVGEEADNRDDYVEPIQLQDLPKDQGEELIEINVTEQGKEAWPIFLSAS